MEPEIRAQMEAQGQNKYFHYMMESTDKEGLTTSHGSFDYLVEAKDEAKKLMAGGVVAEIDIYKVIVTTEIVHMETFSNED